MEAIVLEMPLVTPPQTTSRALYFEQAKLLLRAAPLLLLTEVLAIGAIAWLYADGPASLQAWWLWVLLSLLSIGGRFLFIVPYRRQVRDARSNGNTASIDSRHFLRQLTAVILAGTLPFIIAAPLFVPPTSAALVSYLPTLQLLSCYVALLGLCFVAIGSTAAKQSLMVAYILLVMSPITITSNWDDITGHTTALVALLPVLIIGMLIAGTLVNRVVMHTLRTKLNNRSLISFLETARKDAEGLSNKLAQEMFERREARQNLQKAKERLELMVDSRTKELRNANQELTSTSRLLQLALDASQIAMWEWHLDTDNAFQANAEELLGIKLQPDGVPEQLRHLIHPDDRPAVRHAMTEHLRGNTPYYKSIYRMKHADGSWVWVEDHGQVIERNSDQHATHMIGTRRDVTEQQEAENQRRLAATVFESAAEAIFVFDSKFHFLAVNDSFSYITGFDEDDVIGHVVRPINKENASIYEDIKQQLYSEGFWQGELHARRKNGEFYPQWLQINAVYNDDHQLTHFVAMASDLTERRKGEERLKFLSSHDRLTGLANRKQFSDALQRQITMAHLKRTQVALLYLNIDRFKAINDSLGHQIGDEVLKICAQRLQEHRISDEMVARIDGDEFTILLPYQNDKTVHKLSTRLINCLKQPIKVQDHELLLGASVGISLYPETAEDSHTMISQADIAMHQAKRKGGNIAQLYRSDMRMATIEQLALETSLRKAVTNEEFRVYYQPKLDLANGKIVGAEALVRWQHPTMGLLSPAAFVPLAEETGLITDIGEWVLHEACRQTSDWHKRGIDTHLKMSVNLSAQQFRSTDVVQLVQSALETSQLSPSQLEMEITETLLMDDLEANIDILSDIRGIGVGLSLDDFGTGYSSLSYLKRFPIDELKIDRAFVMDLDGSSEDAAIVQAVITMAHSLNLNVIAEGVETQSQLEILRSMGADAIQGYLISRPVPAEDFEELLTNQHNWRRQQ